MGIPISLAGINRSGPGQTGSGTNRRYSGSTFHAEDKAQCSFSFFHWSKAEYKSLGTQPMSKAKLIEWIFVALHKRFEDMASRDNIESQWTEGIFASSGHR